MFQSQPFYLHFLADTSSVKLVHKVCDINTRFAGGIVLRPTVTKFNHIDVQKVDSMKCMLSRHS